VEQRNAWEGAGTRVQMGFQRDVWQWQSAWHPCMAVPDDVSELASYLRDLYGLTDLTRIDHEQVGAVHSPPITVATRE
jgi:hypothetical protein